MRKICEVIGDFVFAAYWTVYAVLAVGINLYARHGK